MVLADKRIGGEMKQIFVWQICADGMCEFFLPSDMIHGPTLNGKEEEDEGDSLL